MGQTYRVLSAFWAARISSEDAPLGTEDRLRRSMAIAILEFWLTDSQHPTMEKYRSTDSPQSDTEECPRSVRSKGIGSACVIVH
jgi:hypothetical protein